MFCSIFFFFFNRLYIENELKELFDSNDYKNHENVQKILYFDRNEDLGAKNFNEKDMDGDFVKYFSDNFNKSNASDDED